MEKRVERRLAAILAADVAGYSRLMGADEEGTLRDLKAHRRAVVDPNITEHRGRIVKTTGDGMLVEFASVVDAVRCAVDVQRGMIERNVEVPAGQRIEFRLGINVGDIIIDEADIHGDGVNIAARLEGIAEPGGICISSAAYDQVRSKVAVEFADLGEQNLKNIADPVRVYAVIRNGIVPKTNSVASMSFASSAPHLSIVVLPFANIGGDSEQDYFVDGVTECLTTDLSRINGSFVIARNTAFTFKGKAINVKQIGRELNVRYVLEGSVQRARNRLRVNVQLVDAGTGNHLWAERFDKPVADFFDMQDEIVSRLANTLNAQLITAEARLAERTLHPDAMDLYLQGVACVNKGMTPQYTAQAEVFFERALELNPENIEALFGMATVAFNRSAAFIIDDRAARLAAAEAILTRVLSLAPQHAPAHSILGAVQIFTYRATQGIAECQQALALDQNLADAHGWIGLAKYFLGRGTETEAHIHEAFCLSPRDTFAYRWMHIVGIAKAQLGYDAEAITWFRRSIEANRSSHTHFFLAAALALLGELDEAQAAARAGLALDPSFTIRRYRVIASSDNPIYLAGCNRISTGMRMAGLPEG